MSSEMEGHVVGTVESKCCYTWTLENFSFHTGDAVILSPEFPGEFNEKNWRLQLRPFGAFKDGETPYVSLHLLLISFVPGNQNDVSFQLSILNDLGEKEHIFTSRRIQFNTQVGVGGCCRYFVSREELIKNERLLVDDKLKIHCKIWENSMCYEPSCCHQTECLSSTFWKLRLSGILVDFIVDLNGEEVHVHKAIMAIGSPVFASLFENDEVKKTGRMSIADCEPDVFEKFVRYLYLGSLDGLKNFDFDLLAVAEKYGVENLKIICEKSIAANLTVENAARAFMVAEMNKADCLKTKVMDFIKMHLLEIIETESWESLLISQPTLINQVVSALAISTKNVSGQTLNNPRN